MVFMLFVRVVFVSFTSVITLAGVIIMDDVIAAFELRFGDGTHLCEMEEGPGKQPCGYTQGQVAAAFLDARNLPAPFYPQIKSPQAGMSCVTCSSPSSMKTAPLPLLLRLEPADLRRRRRGLPKSPPCPSSRSRRRRSQTKILHCGSCAPSLFARLTILLWSGRGVRNCTCALPGAPGAPCVGGSCYCSLA